MIRFHRTALLGFALGGLPLAANAQLSPVGPTWRVEVLRGASVGGDQAPTLRMRSDGRVQGSTGCNRYDSAPSLNEAGVEFGPLVTTRMACPATRQNLEAAFQDAMTAVRSWRIVGEHLVLSDADGSVLMRLSRAP